MIEGTPSLLPILLEAFIAPGAAKLPSSGKEGLDQLLNSLEKDRSNPAIDSSVAMKAIAYIQTLGPEGHILGHHWLSRFLDRLLEQNNLPAAHSLAYFFASKGGNDRFALLSDQLARLGHRRPNAVAVFAARFDAAAEVCAAFSLLVPSVWRFFDEVLVIQLDSEAQSFTFCRLSLNSEYVSLREDGAGGSEVSNCKFIRPM